MDMPVNAVALEKYFAILKALEPHTAALLVCDAQRAPLWINGDCPLTSSAIVALLQADGAAASTREPRQSYHAHGFPIAASSHSRIAEMILIVDTAQQQQTAGTIASSGAAIAELISIEYQLHDEIDAMAGELVERYEELNLIYHTDDQISDFSTGQKALTNIVGQCLQHLDIDAVILVVPNRNICCIETAPESLLAEQPETIQSLRHSLCTYMQLQNEPKALAVNNAEDANLLQLDFSVPHKFVSCPVVVENNHACGMFVFVREAGKDDFTTGQRNLLATMERKVAKIIQQSYDRLTSLLNRASFQHILESIVADNCQQQTHCLLLLDVKQLHVLNDLGGYQAGDALLISIAALLAGRVGGRGIAARQSGDIFVALLHNCEAEEAEQIARDLQQSINQSGFSWCDEAFRINVNIGIAQLEQGATAKTAINAAEHALAVASERGINRIETYRVSNDATSTRKNRVAWINRVNQALRHEQFELHCQGIYATAGQSDPHHYEILIRMRDSDGSFVSPGNFIPAAEYYQIMPDIDRWVIDKTLAVLHEHWDIVRHFPYSFAINLSGQTISDPDFKAFVSDRLQNSPVPANRLGFEVTETATVENLSGARELLNTIKAAGCELYLDDFGTGLSSFNYLASLPFDYLKIDGSFIKEITADKVSEAMVVAINDVAKVTGLKTVAEFVENQEIIHCLENIGIEYLQGYGLHAPEPMVDILARMRTSRANNTALQPDIDKQ